MIPPGNTLAILSDANAGCNRARQIEAMGKGGPPDPDDGAKE